MVAFIRIFGRFVMPVLTVYWLVMFVGTHASADLQIPLSGHRDKVLHLIAYAGLACLLAWVLRRRGVGRVYTTTFASAAVYGMLDELSQIPFDRHCDFWDWVADMIGTGIGLFVFRRLVMYRESLGARPQVVESSPHR